MFFQPQPAGATSLVSGPHNTHTPTAATPLPPAMSSVSAASTQQQWSQHVEDVHALVRDLVSLKRFALRPSSNFITANADAVLSGAGFPIKKDREWAGGSVRVVCQLCNLPAYLVKKNGSVEFRLQHHQAALHTEHIAKFCNDNFECQVVMRVGNGMTTTSAGRAASLDAVVRMALPAVAIREDSVQADQPVHGQVTLTARVGSMETLRHQVMAWNSAMDLAGVASQWHLDVLSIAPAVRRGAASAAETPATRRNPSMSSCTETEDDDENVDDAVTTPPPSLATVAAAAPTVKRARCEDHGLPEAFGSRQISALSCTSMPSFESLANKIGDLVSGNGLGDHGGAAAAFDINQCSWFPAAEGDDGSSSILRGSSVAF